MRRHYLFAGTLLLILIPFTQTGCPPPPRRTITLDGITFVPIPSGAFSMGALASETGSMDSERPVHTVNITKDYYLSNKEITQGDWLRVMGPVVPYTIQDEINADLPMRRVSWFDAKAFAEAFQERNPSFVFRLPTEAEWERAARAGNSSRFYWGNDPDLSKCDLYAWTVNNSAGDVQVGGQLVASTYGLYDMSGNLGEWVQDRYHENYSGAPVNGSAWGTPEFVQGVDDPMVTIYGVVRGGNYNWNPEEARSASRYQESPDSRRPYSGFRLLLQQPD